MANFQSDGNQIDEIEVKVPRSTEWAVNGASQS